MPTSPHTLERHCAPVRDAHGFYWTAADHPEHPEFKPDTRVSEMYATVEAINAGIRMVEQRRTIAACTSDRCRQSRAQCPTPDACRLPEPAPLAWLTPGRFWWGYAITLASIILGVHLVGR